MAKRSENLWDHTSKQGTKGDKGQGRVRRGGGDQRCMFFCLSLGSMQREGRKPACRWDGSGLEGQVWNLGVKAKM